MAAVPAAVLGDRRLPIMHVDQLREFLDLPPDSETSGYDAYAGALERVLEGVERAVRQVPPEQFRTPTPNRGRDLAELVFNIHDAIAALHTSLDSGSFDWKTDSDFERSRRFATTEELAQFCQQEREGWFERASAVGEEEAAQPVETTKGLLTNRQVLEAQAFHAAQHLRQIYVFLREIGVEPEMELGAEDIRPIELGDLVF
jgi:hypothetical protein